MWLDKNNLLRIFQWKDLRKNKQLVFWSLKRSLWGTYEALSESFWVSWGRGEYIVNIGRGLRI